MRTPHLILAFLLLLVPVLCSSTVVRVDVDGGGDYLTIQEGIDVASEGDTVLVAPGTYAGTGNHDLDFGGRNIMVMSEAGRDSTIIDCEPEHDGFYLHTGEDTTSVIRGFRLQGGECGVRLTSASVTVEECVVDSFGTAVSSEWGGSVFRDVRFIGDAAGFSCGCGVCCNRGPTQRFLDCTFEDIGGLRCNETAAVIRRCDFIRCSQGNHGGGLWCLATDAVLEDVLFEECYISSPFGGMGAALCLEYGPATLDRVQFIRNWSQGGYGVLYFNGSSLTLNEVVLWDNYVGSSMGGGVDCRYADVVTITNSTIVGNSVGTCAIDLEDVDTATIERTIVAHDRVHPIHCGSGATPPTIVNSCFFSNGWGDSLCGDYHDNLFVAPLFCDLTAGDFALHDDSPCLPENNPWGVQIGAYGAGGCGTGVDDSEFAGDTFRVHAPVPTPSSGPVRLSYSGVRPGVPVELSIYDVRGALVRSLVAVSGASGTHTVVWNGLDKSGNPVASGVYYVKGASGTETDRTTLVILR
jgi:hypothetical protein